MDGATLIATLIPIGLIALAFERHIRRPKIGTTFRLVAELARVTFIVFTTLFSLFSLWICVVSVSQGVPIRSAGAWLVGISTGALFLITALSIGEQVIERLFDALKEGQRD
jgi:hypothetical protein